MKPDMERRAFTTSCVRILAAGVLTSAGAVASQGRPALVTGLSGMYESPAPDALPAAFLEKGDTCHLGRHLVDSTGSAWYVLAPPDPDSGKWVRATYLRLVTAQDSSMSAPAPAGDKDRKRRYQAVRENPGWPRVVLRAVREGKICMGMSAAQVRASWDEPFQQRDAFILGAGTHRVWFYRTGGVTVITVHFSNEGVIGWSLEQ